MIFVTLVDFDVKVIVPSLSVLPLSLLKTTSTPPPFKLVLDKLVSALKLYVSFDEAPDEYVGPINRIKELVAKCTPN